jgi:uncharacterized membrane protein
MRRTLEAIGLGGLAVLFWITYSAFNGPNPLPDRIPTHFDAAGDPNGWGSPNMLWLLPVIGASLYLVITVISQFPTSFRYSVQVTETNRARLQQITLSMLAWLKAELVGLFAVLQWWMIQAARSSQGRISPWLMPGFLVVVFTTAGWHVVALFQAAKSSADSSAT